MFNHLTNKVTPQTLVHLDQDMLGSTWNNIILSVSSQSMGNGVGAFKATCR